MDQQKIEIKLLKFEKKLLKIFHGYILKVKIGSIYDIMRLVCLFLQTRVFFIGISNYRRDNYEKNKNCLHSRSRNELCSDD